MSSAPPAPLLDPSIFAYLEAKVDEETQVRDALGQIVQRLDRAVAAAQGLLSRVHSTPRSRYAELVAQVEKAVRDEVAVVKELDGLASKHAYYKYNSKWSRAVQSAMGTAIYCAWLGGFPSSAAAPGQVGRLLTLEELGAIFSAPTNLKDRDAFHLTIEEYLLALTDLTQDLSRLATNAVTHGDFDLPMVISAFVKDLFAGFQLLNLKNDILRKRADAVKYDVKRVEDVVYDLSLRGLVARPSAVDTDMKTEE
ncbi:translin family protein [Hirsutella rhossiliensis]|uniref:Translin family domain-containing protein n=1 Tax=Hirsutella rhossiliensis TaxID=111463 RepID=A0A9P8SEI5_9HYPO|nr:translin family domain-containing protein [Hirsutella rhossiliensis]KAH0958071.1 translin family domain-containing protein [Hirsutella rhossiliensis]